MHILTNTVYHSHKWYVLFIFAQAKIFRFLVIYWTAIFISLYLLFRIFNSSSRCLGMILMLFWFLFFNLIVCRRAFVLIWMPFCKLGVIRKQEIIILWLSERKNVSKSNINYASFPKLSSLNPPVFQVRLISLCFWQIKICVVRLFTGIWVDYRIWMKIYINSLCSWK